MLFLFFRYAKFNAYDIFIFKKPKKIEYSYFTSDFGVRFASFSGLDIFFTEPMNPLINKYNVTDFIYTGHWLNIMPFLTGEKCLFFHVTNLTKISKFYISLC